MSRFWEFSQLSDGFKSVPPISPVRTKAGQKLYIGGLGAFDRVPDLLKQAGITHVLSVLDFDPVQRFPQLGKQQSPSRYSHLYISAEDVADENLLQHFTKTNRFIDAGLAASGAVFVHCAMGVSRSATLVCAYLMWKEGLEAREALERLREGRKVCRPNEGFARQLEVWGRMLKTKDDRERERIYRKWLDGSSSGAKL